MDEIEEVEVIFPKVSCVNDFQLEIAKLASLCLGILVYSFVCFLTEPPLI